MLFWILFSFSLHPFSLFLGGSFCLLISFFTYDLFIEEQEVHRKNLFLRVELITLYLFVLLLRIYLASFDMVYRVLSGNINPMVVRIKTRLRSDLARVVLANSITLTPGTITIDSEKDNLYVHWLETKTTHLIRAGHLIKGYFEIWLRRIFH